MSNQKSIFIFIDWFEPAHKAGGPIVATVNFVNNMKGCYKLYVFTSNKDLGEKNALKDITSDKWIEREENVMIFYASEKSLGLRNIKSQLNKISPDFIYINSIYSKNFSVSPLIIKRLNGLKSKVIVAPRGMLKKSAVDHKRLKKIFFLTLFRLMRLQKNIVYQATDETEVKDVKRHFGHQNQVYLIPDFVAMEDFFVDAVKKETGTVKMIFIGRIHPIKNLLFLLDCLETIETNVLLSIVGNIEDGNYWQQCLLKIKAMPSNITIDMKKDVPHNELKTILLHHHIFVLPTKGENFGHAIFEALTLGKPVIISDQTPWRQLYNKKAGWDISLNEPAMFKKAMEEAISWDQLIYNEWSRNAWQLAKLFVEKTDALSNYKTLFLSMYILGINAYHADSSAAIFKDGMMIAATEEERFTRIKHWAGFPALAIQFCLREAGIDLKDVDYITIGRDPKAKFLQKLNYLRKNPSLVFGAIKRYKNSRDVSSLEEEFRKIDNTVPANVLTEKIKNIEHHRSHLASAFFASPFEEAAILSIDGSGDFTTTMIATGKGNKIEVLDSVDFPVSCGLFYTAFTQFLGFPHYGDEYKVMGLAPYGEAKYTEKVKKLLKFLPNGLFGWNDEYFVQPTKAGFKYENNIPSVGNLYSAAFIKEFGAPRKKEEALSQYHKDLATSVQRVTEELIFYILKHLKERTGMKNVCIAGGVAQNSVANGKIAEATGFEGVYIPSAGHDAGISMGAALYLYNHVLEQPRAAPIYTAYTGSKFSNDEIEVFLKSRNITYRKLGNAELFDVVTNKLIEPGVVGWFSGRAEFGPRALGARSILADPRNSKAKDLLNLKIKRRESFRPFAPSVLKEYSGEYFTKSDAVPFMEKVFPVRPEKQAIIPAVTHVDGTGRLQTVDKNISPMYYGLIEAFKNKTGVPILLNTSFNENEPIVNTPAEALDCFLRTQMDMLVLENCVITRD